MDFDTTLEDNSLSVPGLRPLFPKKEKQGIVWCLFLCGRTGISLAVLKLRTAFIYREKESVCCVRLALMVWHILLTQNIAVYI